MSDIYIGIDNGLDGGVVAIDKESNIIFSHVMPVMSKGKGRELDAVGLLSLIEHPSIVGRRVFALLEEAGKFSAGIMALCSTHDSFGGCKAVLRLSGVRWDKIQPQKWQQTFWARPKMSKGKKFDTKAAALSQAKRIWPDEKWLKSERCSKPHDGMVDAGLLAEYARRQNL